MAEAIPDFIVTNDLFFLAPAGIPSAALQRVSDALKAVLAQKDLVQAYLAQGAIVEWAGADELAARINRDIARWTSIAKGASIQPE